MAKLNAVDDLPTANKLADALVGVYTRMQKANVVTGEGYNAAYKAANLLKSFKDGRSWTTSVDRGEPIDFEICKVLTREGYNIRPRIIARELSVSVEQIEFPVMSWNIALETMRADDPSGPPISRWHFDLANPGQSGPRIHMQYGGHFDHPDYEQPLPIPRWYYPLIDIILLGEIVAANFFEENWRGFRDDTAWCEHISLAEKYCYGVFLEGLNRGYNRSSRTILCESWGDRWQPIT